jgi:hypothetical protein
MNHSTADELSAVLHMTATLRLHCVQLLVSKPLQQMVLLQSNQQSTATANRR